MNVVTLEDVLNSSEDPGQAWKSRAVERGIQKELVDWLAGATRWTSFGTLTLRDIRPPDVAKRYFLRLVQLINKQAFGAHYVEKVGHSYFNYVCGMEFQQREVVHFHFLADRPLPYKFIHQWWNLAMGFAHIDQIKDPVKSVAYVTKYVLKGGAENLDIYLKGSHRVPVPLPPWWIDIR